MQITNDFLVLGSDVNPTDLNIVHDHTTLLTSTVNYLAMTIVHGQGYSVQGTDVYLSVRIKWFPVSVWGEGGRVVVMLGEVARQLRSSLVLPFHNHASFSASSESVTLEKGAFSLW